MYLFAHHQFSFALAAFASAKQLHHSKRNDCICFNTQLHQRSEIPPPHSDPLGVSIERYVHRNRTTSARGLCSSTQKLEYPHSTDRRMEVRAASPTSAGAAIGEVSYVPCMPCKRKT